MADYVEDKWIWKQKGICIEDADSVSNQIANTTEYRIFIKDHIVKEFRFKIWNKNESYILSIIELYN